MTSMRVLAVVNPAAGGPGEEFVAVLADTGVDLQVVHTAGPGDGTRCTADAVAAVAPDVVVSVGGDGTAGEVARGLVQAGPGTPPLLIAPAGTGNSNFRGVWDDRPWPEVVDAVFGARRYAVRPMDLLHLAELDTATLLGVSAGMIPECLEVARTLSATGRERLLTAAVQVLAGYTPYPTRVTVDGRVLCECPAMLVVVGGVRYRGGMLKLLPDSVLDDGLLDV
ncbi:MAG TPA: diacylglycerol kinase family protein, partial [Pseudonocardia sp.]|nr:diacylglycerol kinase family protein [Pseudonocardia sp.]